MPRRSVGQSLAALFDSGSNGPRWSPALESDWGAGGAGSGKGSGVGSGAGSGAGCGIGSGCWIGCCADPRSFTASNRRKLPSRSFFRMSKGKCMAASCVGSDVRQTGEGRRRSRSVKTSRGGPETNPSGSDNLLTEVCALTSWKYSLLASLRESREQQQGQTQVPLLKHQPSPARELSTDPVEMKRGLRGGGLGGLRTRGSCGCRIRIHRQSFHPSEDRHGPIRLAAIPQIVVGETA